MSLTITPTADPTTAAKRFVIGDRRCVVGVVTFDSSYPTGGEAITPGELGFDFEIDYISFGVPTIARLVSWDQTNNKALVYTALGTEAVNASDQSTLVGVPFMAIGK